MSLDSCPSLVSLPFGYPLELFWDYFGTNLITQIHQLVILNARSIELEQV